MLIIKYRKVFFALTGILLLLSLASVAFFGLTLGNRFPATIERFTEIGPTVGIELRNKSLIALSLVLVCILLYIAFAFRKVSQPVSSWIYGMIALVTLLHDV